jgi:2-polyprenyl-6-methoxyphenol hydroxylase-like FAD-dependent oxidoreductase
MSSVGKHAIVIGMSMAGLGAARALVNHFERVTIIERDVLSSLVSTRKGVPQGNHAHGLLPAGYRVLDGYFPGLMQELEQSAPAGDLTEDFLWYQYGGWKLRTKTDLRAICISRPFLETNVRARVRALSQVTVLDGHEVERPVFDAAYERVTGLRVLDLASGKTRTLDADLTVDCTGRGSVCLSWLEDWGFGRVPETEVRVDVGYATAVFARKPGDFHASTGGIVAGTVPESGRFAAVLGAEGDRWIITLGGALKDYPPTELAGWLAFARTLPTQDVYELVKDRTPLQEIASFRFQANRRRHFESLRRFPSGFLVLGDALCSFNPIYGQGMSVALSEAKALDECLAHGAKDLFKPFFARAAAIIEGPWTIATGEDFRFPQVAGKRPPGFALVSRYMARAHRVAMTDPVVLKRFFEVASLLAPPTAMMAPNILWRVLRAGAQAKPQVHTPQLKSLPLTQRT